MRCFHGDQVTVPADNPRFLTSITQAGMLVIHSSPVTLSWIPRDIVNDVYNVGGTVTVGTFDSVDAAKRAANEQYFAIIDNWQASDALPFDSSDETGTENHTPDVDGHNIRRHGIHWK
jgi:hypothetical protein